LHDDPTRNPGLQPGEYVIFIKADAKA